MCYLCEIPKILLNLPIDVKVLSKLNELSSPKINRKETTIEINSLLAIMEIPTEIAQTNSNCKNIVNKDT